MATQSTTTTSLSKAHTVELFTGDLVHLDNYSKDTASRVFKVLAYVKANSCESGTLVCVQATGNRKEKYTLDRHWLLLHARASTVIFEDDIPF